MKVVVPLAGRGSRFADQGVGVPKPLIPVRDRPMIAWALESLSGVSYSRVIFVALAEHEVRYGVVDLLRRLVNRAPAEVILLPGVTEGQLCTVLAAEEIIDGEEDLLVASADTYVVSDLGGAIAARSDLCRGIISVVNMPGDRWSFARTDETGRVVEVAEKARISDHASTGLYYFSSGKEFVEAARGVIRGGEKTRGEYYIMPVYQKYIDRGWWVGISKAMEMWDMGTPAALEAFQSHVVSVGAGPGRRS